MRDEIKPKNIPNVFNSKPYRIHKSKLLLSLFFSVAVDSPFFRCCFRYLNEQSEIRTSPPYGVYVYLCIVRNCQLNYMKMPSCFLFIEALELCAISQSFSISLALLGDESKLNFTSTRFNQRTGKIPCKKASINSFNNSNLRNFSSADSKWILFWDGVLFPPVVLVLHTLQKFSNWTTSSLINIRWHFQFPVSHFSNREKKERRKPSLVSVWIGFTKNSSLDFRNQLIKGQKNF